MRHSENPEMVKRPLNTEDGAKALKNAAESSATTDTINANGTK